MLLFAHLVTTKFFNKPTAQIDSTRALLASPCTTNTIHSWWQLSFKERNSLWLLVYLLAVAKLPPLTAPKVKPIHSGKASLPRGVVQAD